MKCWIAGPLLLAVCLAVGCSRPIGSGVQPADPAPQTPAPTPVTPDVGQELSLEFVKMVTEQVGWGTAQGKLFRTADAGRHWATVTPPGLRKDAWVAADYRDAQTAWAIASTQRPEAVVYRTHDGGASWQSTPLVLTSDIPGKETNRPTSAYFSDAEHGWLLIEPDHGMNSSPGGLLTTTDGGVHWSEVANTLTGLPSGGFQASVRFRGPQDGWLAGQTGSTEPRQLTETHDGGRTWRRSELPAPGQLPPGVITVAAPPEFFAGGQRGIVIGTLLPESHRDAEFNTIIWSTDDGGKRWQPLAPLGPAQRAVVAFATPAEGWVSTGTTGSRADSKLYHTADGGKTWQMVPPDPVMKALLRDGNQVVQLSFPTPKAGWALLQAEGKSASHLLQTSDGGITWIAMKPSAIGQ